MVLIVPGDISTQTVITFTNAPVTGVPEPGTGWLFGLGLSYSGVPGEANDTRRHGHRCSRNFNQRKNGAEENANASHFATSQNMEPSGRHLISGVTKLTPLSRAALICVASTR